MTVAPKDGHAATRTVVGNGQETLFWEDRWLQGFRICELPPLVYDRVPKRARLVCTVSAAMEDASWAGDIGPNITKVVLQQFLLLWSRVAIVQLDTGMPDSVN